MSAMIREILDDRNPWFWGNKARVPDFKRFLYYRLYGYLRDNKVLVLLGVRQIGKTTVLQQIANDVSGLYRVFYVPVDAVVEYVEKGAVREAVSTIEKYYLGRKIYQTNRPTILIFDEIHFDNDWGLQVKVLYDKLAQWGAPTKIFVTGSSAISIEMAVARYLTGRARVEYMNPMSLGEFVAMKVGLRPALLEAMGKSLQILESNNIEPIVEEVMAITAPWRPILEKALSEMLIYGGMPEIIARNLRGIEAQRTLESYLYITLYKDVLKILDYLGEKIKLAGRLDRLVRALLYKSPRIVSTNAIATDLGISLETVENYLELILATHLVQRANNYSRSPIVEAKKKKHKYYSCDTGIRNAIIWGILPKRVEKEEEGLLLENIALIHAKRILKRTSWRKNPKFIKIKDKEGDVILEYKDKAILIEAKRKEKRIRQPQKFGIQKILQIALYEQKNAIPATIFLLADPIYQTLKQQTTQ